MKKKSVRFVKRKPSRATHYDVAYTKKQAFQIARGYPEDMRPVYIFPTKKQAYPYGLGVIQRLRKRGNQSFFY